MNKLAKKLSNVLGSSPRAAPRQNSRRRRRARRYRRMARRSNASRVPRGILAGYGSAVTASFYQSRRGDGEIVRGFDLITSPYNPTVLSNPNISYFITANPAAWNGTRIAAIAGGYQNYRPLSFKIHYRPQVGSTSTISMFIGTVWQNTYITSRSSIEPSLVTSPGGTYLPAWQSCCSVVPLGRRLPQRMFPIRDPDFTTVPFSVVCRASEGGPNAPSVEMPGRIFIEYAYEFRNAIGSGSGFQPSRVTQLPVTRQGLYSGATSLGYASLLNQYEDGSAGYTGNGWLIDVGAPASGSSTTDSYIRNSIPLFSRIDTDEVLAAISEGGSVARRPILQINGTAVNNAELASFTLISYSDDGKPS